jgi:hypothetical protein
MILNLSTYSNHYGSERVKISRKITVIDAEQRKWLAADRNRYTPPDVKLHHRMWRGPSPNSPVTGNISEFKRLLLAALNIKVHRTTFQSQLRRYVLKKRGWLTKDNRQTRAFAKWVWNGFCNSYLQKATGEILYALNTKPSKNSVSSGGVKPSADSATTLAASSANSLHASDTTFCTICVAGESKTVMIGWLRKIPHWRPVFWEPQSSPQSPTANRSARPDKA